MGLYLITNGPAPTTAAHAAVTTGTSIKTLLQAKPKKIAKIVEWGISFNGSAAATPIKVERGLTFGRIARPVIDLIFIWQSWRLDHCQRHYDLEVARAALIVEARR